MCEVHAARSVRLNRTETARLQLLGEPVDFGNHGDALVVTLPEASDQVRVDRFRSTRPSRVDQMERPDWHSWFSNSLSRRVLRHHSLHMAQPNERLSIVHLAAPARFGGLESVLATLVPAQLEAGDLVRTALILAPDDAEAHPLVESLEKAGASVEVLPISGRGYLQERREVARLLGEASADVVHTHGYRPDINDAPVARRAGIPVVSTAHGFTGAGTRGRFYEWLQVRSLCRFDAVVAVSEPLKKDLVRRGVAERKVHMIPNAWRPAQTPLGRAEARSVLGVEGDGPRVAWIGRLTDEKGPDVFVRAAAASTASRS